MEQFLDVAVMIVVNFLLTLNPNEQHYYNPIITNIKNPSFCVLGAGTTAIFKNYIPPMPPNKGLNKNQFNFDQETDISMLKEKVSKLEKENEEQKKKHSSSQSNIKVLDDDEFNNLEKLEKN